MNIFTVPAKLTSIQLTVTFARSILLSFYKVVAKAVSDTNFQLVSLYNMYWSS